MCSASTGCAQYDYLQSREACVPAPVAYDAVKFGKLGIGMVDTEKMGSELGRSVEDAPERTFSSLDRFASELM